MKRLLMSGLLLSMTPALAGGADFSPTAFELSLQREACYGTCPVYTVQVNGNGAVLWTGERWVQQVGKLRATVNPAAVKRLQQAVKAANFFVLKDEYLDMPVTDLPYATLEVRQGMQHKTVHYYLGDPNVPPALLNLAKQADLELGTAAWIGQR
ncbi:DUF6438 domain-containing protein [Deinococcus oregonensis]|uniref:DUF6438 domain-containing protein n=1 Tax=Deinococcus oregonensis TaxID=1805970 RepID=A0ABV6B0M5_9DEIO